MSKYNKELMLQQIKAGEKIEVIAMIHGCNPTTVSLLAIKHGYRRLTKCVNLKERDIDVSSDYQSGMKVADIAAKYGIDITHVYRSLKRQGIKPNRSVKMIETDIFVESFTTGQRFSLSVMQ